MQNTINTKLKVALADDHILLRTALASLIDQFDDCTVIFQVSNGKDLISQIAQGQRPDVLLLDLNMPEMDGYAAAKWMQEHQPGIHVLMLTMYDSELAMIRLLQAGVKGFLKKDIHPSELQFAIRSVMQSGYYYSHNTTGKLVNLFLKKPDNTLALQRSLLSETELRFLELVCTEMTYKEIAMSMKLNPRAVDNLRDQLFEKLMVKSRIGLAMYAVRHGLVTF